MLPEARLHASAMMRIRTSVLLPSVDADRRPRLRNGTLDRAAAAVQIACGLNGRRSRHGECGVRGQERRKPAVEHLLDLVAIAAAYALHRETRCAIGSALDRQVEGVAGDRRVGVHLTVIF